jgi:hypothetical protein
MALTPLERRRPHCTMEETAIKYNSKAHKAKIAQVSVHYLEGSTPTRPKRLRIERPPEGNVFAAKRPAGLRGVLETNLRQVA